MRIMITGGSGMVGKNLIYFLNKNTKHELLFPSSSELNLFDLNSVKSYIEKEKPDTIIHCAGRVGGIQANIEQPYSFLFQNFCFLLIYKIYKLLIFYNLIGTQQNKNLLKLTMLKYNLFYII